MGRVVIGMDPHKRAATIEVLDEPENVLATGLFGTDHDGYGKLIAAGREWPDRVRAVEGCQAEAGTSRSVLVAEGEPAVDVPAKLWGRARVLSTAQAARPTPPMRTGSPWWRRGCWWTGATNSARPRR